MGVRVKSYAKLNLTLAITGRENGYHMLDSLVCSVDLYDLIKLDMRSDKTVNVFMHGLGTEAIPPEQNNAVKAAEAYVERFGSCGADIHIFKNIPVGAGLGGSSADAAGVLRGMNKLYNLAGAQELKELADGLGSDTGYMLKGGFARLSGRGDRVEHINCSTRLDFVLLTPPSGVSTAQCYSRYDQSPKRCHSSENAVEALVNGDVGILGSELDNALYPAAAGINGDVEKAYNELLEFAPLGVSMTGSGSGVFALFGNIEFCRWAKSRYRGKFDCMILRSVVPEND